MSSKQLFVENNQLPNWVGTAAQFHWVESLLYATIVMNVVDAIFTMYWVYSGRATEANPLMEVVIDSPFTFTAVKISLVSFGCFLLWKRHKRPFAVIGIVTIFLVYYATMLHHLRAINLDFLFAYMNL